MKRISLIVATSLLLGGCAVMDPAPEDHFYRLTTDAASTSVAAVSGGIEVERFSADGVTGSRNVTHSTDENRAELAEFHYHYWAEPPAILVQSALVSYLRESGAADQVTTPDMRANAAYRIGGRIKAFELVRGGNNRAVVVLEMSLMRTKDRKILVLDDYRAEIPANGDVATGIQAANTAVGEIFARFLQQASKSW